MIRCRLRLEKDVAYVVNLKSEKVVITLLYNYIKTTIGSFKHELVIQGDTKVWNRPGKWKHLNLERKTHQFCLIVSRDS